MAKNRLISIKTICLYLLLIVISWGLISCGDRIETSDQAVTEESSERKNILSEVAPPAVIQQLSQSLEQYNPQVTILSPQADELLDDTTVTVKLEVKDLPIFKAPNLELGPNLQLIVDKQPPQTIYNVDEPIVLENLAPGSHILRVFASFPWYESFKNEGAYAQTIFHVFTKTNDVPDPSLPLLTYNRPSGTYGAEPIMVDYYLTNAPLHEVARKNPQDSFGDWRIKVTVNGESFILDSWEPFYLKGFKPGTNWIQLEYIDEKGQKVCEEFNNIVRVISYDPQAQDSLSKLVRGEISAEVARAIVDFNYQTEIKQPQETPVNETPVVEEPALTTEETPAPEESKTEEPALTTEETPAPEESKTEEPALTTEETPAPEETLIIKEIPAPEESKTEEPALIIKEIPAPEEIKTEEPALTTEETPAPEETLIIKEIPAPEETLIIKEIPAPEEIKTEEPALIIEEIPAPEEIKTEEPALIIEEIPTPEETVKDDNFFTITGPDGNQINLEVKKITEDETPLTTESETTEKPAPKEKGGFFSRFRLPKITPLAQQKPQQTPAPTETATSHGDNNNPVVEEKPPETEISQTDEIKEIESPVCLKQPDPFVEPANLVSLAYLGGFQKQGISSNTSLIEDYNTKKVTVEDIVKAAIANCVLDNKYNLVENASYLQDVAKALQLLNNP